ncbi:NUDIX hydrolase [Candidatus Gottesmanbacteria bacterium]|nr:NUDIX hydrolase [Candidatus Gottesmanbacteria bacterium]
MKKQTKAVKSWKELSRHTLLERYGRGLDKVLFRLPDGRKESYVVKKEKPTVAIFAITKDKRVILIEQFRPGPKKVIQELPGGYLDKGETPLKAAKRELYEETGHVGVLKPLFHYHDCAYSPRVRHYFIATKCYRSKTGQRAMRGEERFSRVVLVPFRPWVKKIYKNPPTDIACVLAGLRMLK